MDTVKRNILEVLKKYNIEILATQYYTKTINYHERALSSEWSPIGCIDIFKRDNIGLV